MKKNSEAKINLLYYKFEEKRGVQEKKCEYSVYVSIFLILILALGSLYFFQWQNIRDLEAQTIQLEENIAEISDVHVFMETLEKENEQLKVVRVRVQNLEDMQYNVVDLMDELYILSESKVILAKIELKKNHLLINAFTNNTRSFLEFMEKLKISPYFQDPQMINTQVDEENGEVSFNMELYWEEVEKIDEHN